MLEPKIETMVVAEISGRSRVGSTGSSVTTAMIVSWRVAPLKGGRPVRHS